MHRQLLGVALASLIGSAAVFAGDFGSAGEAKAMLVKVIAEVQADEAKALAKFRSGDEEFKD